MDCWFQWLFCVQNCVGLQLGCLRERFSSTIFQNVRDSFSLKERVLHVLCSMVVKSLTFQSRTVLQLSRGKGLQECFHSILTWQSSVLQGPAMSAPFLLTRHALRFPCLGLYFQILQTLEGLLWIETTVHIERGLLQSFWVLKKPWASLFSSLLGKLTCIDRLQVFDGAHRHAVMGTWELTKNCVANSGLESSCK